MTTTAVQTTVDNAPGIGAAGMMYDETSYHDVVSVKCSQDIPFGAYVCIKANVASLPGASGDVTGYDGGIAVHSQEYATEAGYKSGDVINVLRAGRIWVTTEDANATDGQPYIRYTANVAPVGSIRSDADSGKAVQKPGVYIHRGNAAGGLAVLTLNGRVGS